MLSIRSSLTGVVWLKDGVRQERKQSEDLSILLDLGALDSYELLRNDKCRVVVLTEDSKADRLIRLLEINGFPKDRYMIQPFNGVSNIMMCAAVADFFLKQGNDTHVLLHRDSDCMLPDEITWYETRKSTKLPDRCQLFFTPLTDIEHQFCQPVHVAAALDMTVGEATALVEEVITDNAAKLAMEFAQKRADLKSKILRDKDNVPSATDLAQQRVTFEQVRGKRLWGLLITALTAQGRNPMLLLSKESQALRFLRYQISRLKFGPQRNWPNSPHRHRSRPKKSSRPLRIPLSAEIPKRSDWTGASQFRTERRKNRRYINAPVRSQSLSLPRDNLQSAEVGVTKSRFKISRLREPH